MKNRRIRLLTVLLVMIFALSVPVTAYAAGEDSLENEVDESNNSRFGSTSPWLSGSQKEFVTLQHKFLIEAV